MYLNFVNSATSGHHGDGQRLSLKAAKIVRLLVLLLLQTLSTAAHILNLFRTEDGLFVCESKFNLRGQVLLPRQKPEIVRLRKSTYGGLALDHLVAN